MPNNMTILVDNNQLLAQQDLSFPCYSPLKILIKVEVLYAQLRIFIKIKILSWETWALKQTTLLLTGYGVGSQWSTS